MSIFQVIQSVAPFAFAGFIILAAILVLLPVSK
jgi:hypothetical protein